MSDNWIILIPEKAGFVPPEGKQRVALEKLQSLTPEADKTEIENTEKIRFVDCGGNFEQVRCPACNQEIEMDWWQEKMNDDFGDDSDFKLKPIELPCCGAVKTLHELNYDFQQGFARFGLSTMNPNIGELPKEIITAIEAILDCQLRVIYCHI